MNFKNYKTGPLIVFILVLSFPCKFLANKIELLIRYFEFNGDLASYLNVFSTVGLISMFLFGVNQWGWRHTIFKWLIDVPNLNGRYEGELVSSHYESGVPVRKLAVMEVKQTGSHIHIDSYFGDPGNQTSCSASYSEEIVKLDNGLFQVYYIFSNETEPLLMLSNHDGTASFKYFPDKKSIECKYYNQKKNTGTIKLVYKSKKLIGRLEQ